MMLSFLSHRQTICRPVVRTAILGLITLLFLMPLAACGGSASPTNNGPVTLTFWSWVPNIQNEIALFEQSHPNIKIKLINAGQGGPEYTKLRTALKAGSGAPDVVQLELQYLPTFELIHGLADLSPYGANDLKNDYVSWVWNQVSQGTKVYAIPQDSGPMGLLYRADIFQQYHLAVPTTWDQFAQEAATLHKANPKIYLTDFAPNDGAWFNGLIWQAGSHPFSVNGTTVSVHLNDTAAQQVSTYWGNLINEHLVQTTPDFTNDWYSGLANGTYASWVTAAWGPVFLSGIAGKTAGDWRAVPLPQWNAGQHASGNWGGSTDAVTTQSKYPQQAATFAMWLNHDQQAATMIAQKQFLFPTLQSVLNNPTFVNAPSSFYGGQQVNQVFVSASSEVDTTFQWSPFQDYVYTQWQNDFGLAINGKSSFPQALEKLQSDTVTYAKSQGFSVN